MAGKALSIGINYTGTSNALSGCINDSSVVLLSRCAIVRTRLDAYSGHLVHPRSNNLVKFICERYQYKQEDVVILQDKPGASQRELPTRDNIIRAMHWLVAGAAPNDSLFFHYSGHGGQAKDLDGDEDDGYEYVITNASCDPLRA